MTSTSEKSPMSGTLISMDFGTGLLLSLVAVRNLQIVDPLQQQTADIAQNSGEESRKSSGLSAIDDPVIIRQGQRQDQAWNEFAVLVNRFHAGAGDAQNCNFRCINNWRESNTANPSET